MVAVVWEHMIMGRNEMPNNHTHEYVTRNWEKHCEHKYETLWEFKGPSLH
jgi:hypothetical protein